MAFEQKPNSGSIFSNDRKESDKHPDRTGQALIECPHCGKSWSSWLNCWLKKTKDGAPYLSLSFKPKEDRGGQGQRSGGGGGRGRDDRGGNRYEEETRGGRSAGPDVRGGSYRDKPFSDEDIPF